MKISDRIKKLRELRGFSQVDLAQIIGVDVNTIWRWENGRSSPVRSIQKLAQALDTSTGYLLGETDDPRRPDRLGFEAIVGTETARISKISPESNIRLVRGKLVDVPVLAPQSSICCGKGFNLAEVEAEVDWWEPIPESWLTGPKGDKPFFITHVEGDSMEPMIEDGERILINPNQEVTHGDIAVACWNGRSMVRGVKFERDGTVRLIPVNKNYDEDVIAKKDRPFVLEFCGVVVRFLGKDRVSRGIL